MAIAEWPRRRFDRRVVDAFARALGAAVIACAAADAWSGVWRVHEGALFPWRHLPGVPLYGTALLAVEWALDVASGAALLLVRRRRAVAVFVALVATAMGLSQRFSNHRALVLIVLAFVALAPRALDTHVDAAAYAARARPNLALVRAQLVIVYAFSALNKVAHGFLDGAALTCLFGWPPRVARPLSFAVVAAEIAIPLLLGAAPRVGLACVVALHLAMAALLPAVWPFSLVMIAMALLFLPAPARGATPDERAGGGARVAARRRVRQLPRRRRAPVCRRGGAAARVGDVTETAAKKAERGASNEPCEVGAVSACRALSMTTHDPVSLLRELVAVDTSNPGGSEVELAGRLRERLAAHAPDALESGTVARPGRADAAWLLATWGTPRSLLNAHLDTVPAQRGWSGDPWTLREAGDRVVGLGAADTKGAIAAILAALAGLQLAGARPRDCAILFSGDEEAGSLCMRAFLRDRGLAGCARAIVCEPTSCRPGVRHRGYVSIEIAATAPGGHSSAADTRDAPVADVAAVGVALSAWSRALAAKHADGGMCVNLAEIRGSTSPNVIPPRATLSLSLRPPPGAPLDAVLDEVRARARDACPRAEVDVTLAQPPFATRDLEAFRPWLRDACDAALPLDFWTEAALLAEAGIDAVVLGPGDIAQAHAADEWVAVRDLVRAQEIFARVLSGDVRHAGT